MAELGWQRFPYQISVDFYTWETIYQPVLTNIIASNGHLKMPLDMLVDSGGQDTLLHADFAPTLGIDLSKCKKRTLGGIAGTVEGFVHPVTFTFQKPKDTFTVDVTFVPKLGTTSILGQIDFFPRYYVKFDRSTSGFFLKKVTTLNF
jgi:hypothetical protein